MTNQETRVEVVDRGGGIAARWARAEQAFQLVRLEGRSLRQVAQDLGVSHNTVWADVRAYEQYLGKAHGAGDIGERRAAFEQLVYEVLAECRDIIRANPTKPLVKTAALNTMNSALSHLRAVRGLDVPKTAEPAKPGVVRVSWGNGGEDTE